MNGQIIQRWRIGSSWSRAWWFSWTTAVAQREASTAATKLMKTGIWRQRSRPENTDQRNNTTHGFSDTLNAKEHGGKQRSRLSTWPYIECRTIRHRCSTLAGWGQSGETDEANHSSAPCIPITCATFSSCWICRFVSRSECDDASALACSNNDLATHPSLLS